jgi:hypothetical protein
MSSNLLARIEEDKPTRNGQEWQEELPSDRQEKGEEEESRDRGLAQRAGGLNDGQGEEAEDQE